MWKRASIPGSPVLEADALPPRADRAVWHCLNLRPVWQSCDTCPSHSLPGGFLFDQKQRSGAGIMEADDRQVTTVFTVQPSFHHRHSTNPSIMKPRRSPTIVTLHDTRFVECWWWNDGWTVKTVVTWRSSASMIPAPGHWGICPYSLHGSQVIWTKKSVYCMWCCLFRQEYNRPVTALPCWSGTETQIMILYFLHGPQLTVTCLAYCLYLINGVKNEDRNQKGCFCLMTAERPSNMQCVDSCRCCLCGIEAADQTGYLTRLQYTDTCPTSPSTDLITSGALQGSQQSTWGRYHGGRRPSSDDSFHSPTVIPSSALDKPSVMKRCHRQWTCSHTSPRRSPTMVTLHDIRFVKCRWWNDG